MLGTTQDVNTLLSNSANHLWTEFLYTTSRPYPSVMASTLHTPVQPIMHFYASGLANGAYTVYANLYDTNPLRYFYGYTSADPSAAYVDTTGGATGTQHREYSLGTVNITNGSFDLYVDTAQQLPGATYDIFGWAWIRLAPQWVPANNMTLSSDSSTMRFDGNGNGVFGEPGDNVKLLANGILTITVQDTASGSVTITATDFLGQTGSNTYLINSSAQPPVLPHHCYGEIHVSDPVPQAGDLVQVQIAGVSRVITTAITSQAGITLTYQIDVPGDVSGTPEKEGGAEGEVITFTIGSRVVATSEWHGGTNTRLDFHSHSVTLQPGWNLVSFNLSPVSDAITDVLSSLTGYYDLVYAWDGASQQWFKYDDVPMSGDSLLQLNERQGFWLHVTGTQTRILTIYGRVPETTNLALATGWNLVGYPSSVARALPDALSGHGVGTDFSLVYAYHADVLTDPWKLFDRAATYSNDLMELSPGWGYWIQTTAANTWHVEYQAP